MVTVSSGWKATVRSLPVAIGHTNIEKIRQDTDTNNCMEGHIACAVPIQFIDDKRESVFHSNGCTRRGSSRTQPIRYGNMF